MNWMSLNGLGRRQFEENSKYRMLKCIDPCVRVFNIGINNSEITL